MLIERTMLSENPYAFSPLNNFGLSPAHGKGDLKSIAIRQHPSVDKGIDSSMNKEG